MKLVTKPAPPEAQQCAAVEMMHCTLWHKHGGPHSFECSHPPSSGEPRPPNLSDPTTHQAYEAGVDTGFKIGQMNQDQIKWWFDEREAAVIDEIASKQELSRQQVLRQALRTYQLVVMGTHDKPAFEQKIECVTERPSQRKY